MSICSKLAILPCIVSACYADASGFKDFVKVEGDQLVSEGKPFRFISWNVPNLHLVEDNVAFNNFNPWRLPDSFEINDALSTVRELHGQVVRTYVLSVRRTNEGPEIPRHVLGPKRFNEEAFRALDQVLQAANEKGVRVIVPFVDNWSWWGGRAEYARYRGKSKDQFWTDPQIIDDFKETIRFTLTRTNTLTGIRYSEDKAILCWETGNELESPASWTREIAGFIKSLAPHQLVMDGFHATELREESLAMPEVDIVTTHHYPGGKKSFDELIRKNAARAKGRKPYLVGEFGFETPQAMTAAIQAVIDTQTVGALAWSLRFRNRDGGFYWHSEPAGGNKYKAFHWPGSPIADDYDETGFMTLMRRQAFAILDKPLPEPGIPEPPRLLPITNAAAISWQGSPGAINYVVERASQANGPWITVAKAVDESFTQYRPLWSDETVTAGSWWYRVRARNSAGTSLPSNLSGPVKVSHVWLIDELADFSRVDSQTGDLRIETRDCRAAMEDAHRAAGNKGATIVYRLTTPLSKANVFAFFPKEHTDLKLALSVDGQTFRPAPAVRKDFQYGAGDYGYWGRSLYKLNQARPEDRFLKITFTGEAQIGRVEIEHEAAR